MSINIFARAFASYTNAKRTENGQESLRSIEKRLREGVIEELKAKMLDKDHEINYNEMSDRVKSICGDAVAAYLSSDPREGGIRRAYGQAGRSKYNFISDYYRRIIMT